MTSHFRPLRSASVPDAADRDQETMSGLGLDVGSDVPASSTSRPLHEPGSNISSLRCNLPAGFYLLKEFNENHYKFSYSSKEVNVNHYKIEEHFVFMAKTDVRVGRKATHEFRRHHQLGAGPRDESVLGLVDTACTMCMHSKAWRLFSAGNDVHKNRKVQELSLR